MIDERLMHVALGHYGEAGQLRVLQEECGELIVAVSHYFRGRTDAPEELAEELADVTIMVAQARLIVGEKAADDALARKLERLARRMREAT